MKNNKLKIKKAFSLAEMVVSLGIISIVITIFFNALLISMTITVRNTFRSNVREEISSIISLISKDIRASESILGTTCVNNSCEIVVYNKRVRWEICGSQICKRDNNNNIIYQSPVDIRIENFSFEQGYVDSSTTLKNNILVTIIASHTNANLKITNVIRQASVSTRNYELQ